MIFIDNRSRVPIYEQIKEQIIMLINNEILKPDDQLPSIRSLSNQLNINVNTIKRAFAELEAQGVTYSIQGRGVFVAQNPVDNPLIIKSAMEDISIAVKSGKAKGVDKKELIQLIDKIYEEEDDDA
ncbi:MAG: GntR family transcriptional regulator [Acetobacter sp.]|nr:GntR family transcriptional regulator [Bacteroides sp.]MCM1340313.1 GntR family transcriptional regulator [Acetobacter sp.]MCM1433040.1 GntR family transcriptional regulator [Clostridiales bacterium]